MSTHESIAPTPPRGSPCCDAIIFALGAFTVLYILPIPYLLREAIFEEPFLRILPSEPIRNTPRHSDSNTSHIKGSAPVTWSVHDTHHSRPDLSTDPRPTYQYFRSKSYSDRHALNLFLLSTLILQPRTLTPGHCGVFINAVIKPSPAGLISTRRMTDGISPDRDIYHVCDLLKPKFATRWLVCIFGVDDIGSRRCRSRQVSVPSLSHPHEPKEP